MIAFVLGEIAERSFHQVRLISDGHVVEYMLSRPISVLLIAATFVTFPAARHAPDPLAAIAGGASERARALGEPVSGRRVRVRNRAQRLPGTSGPLVDGAVRTCLAIADGEGRNGVWLAQQGLRVTSQDFSATAQDKARGLASERGVTLAFELSDVTTRTWQPERYDVVAGIFFQFLSPPDRARVFAGIRRTLRPGGLVLIEGYGPRQLEYGTGGPKVLENLYTEDLLRDAFAGFTDIRVAAYDAEVSEGSGHHGMSALVDLAARRPL